MAKKGLDPSFPHGRTDLRQLRRDDAHTRDCSVVRWLAWMGGKSERYIERVKQIPKTQDSEFWASVF